MAEASSVTVPARPAEAGIDLPQRDDGADHQRIDHEVHAVERPARGAGPERPPLRHVHVAIEGEKAGIFDLGAFDRAGSDRQWSCAFPRQFLAEARLAVASTPRGAVARRRSAQSCRCSATSSIVPPPPRRACADRARRANRSGHHDRIGRGLAHRLDDDMALRLQLDHTSSGKPRSIRTSSGSHW